MKNYLIKVLCFIFGVILILISNTQSVKSKSDHYYCDSSAFAHDRVIVVLNKESSFSKKDYTKKRGNPVSSLIPLFWALAKPSNRG